MTEPTASLLDVALARLGAGLSVLPAHREQKYAAIHHWKPYQLRLPTPQEVAAWFSNSHDALCLVTGGVSGNLEMLDFDAGGELFEPWRSAVAMPGLLDRLVIESTPSGGRHVAYRSTESVCGSLKLAQRRIETPDSTPVTIAGKQHTPRKDAQGRWHVVVTLVETRGEGGLFLCAPSPGYQLLQGDFTQLPVLSAEERDALLMAAWALNEYVPAPEPVAAQCPNGARPGDDYAARGDVRDVLTKHGWTLARSGENEYWRRPGKTSGWSATLKDRVFYVFSSNAAPFEPGKAYGPFGVYALLEHGGDFASAARALRAEGYSGDEAATGLPAGTPSQPKSLRQLVQLYPALRKPVIEGLLREGETANVISAPKIGKSWLVLDLALAVATGRPWLGMDCTAGEVLILDNELHPETSANRIPKVAAARGIDIEAVADRIYVENVRGRLQDLFALGPYFRQFTPGRFKIVILDAFYRFLPMRTDENDNGTMASLYNYLDSFADYLQCSFVLIHHTSKGNQSLKEVTDVGAGAGAQSRATDTHLILRRHEEDDVVVLDAAVRSWPPVPPRCLRWAFPVWMPADDLDPTALKKEGGKRSAADGGQQPKSYDAAGFVERFLTEQPKSQARILEQAEVEGLSSRRVKRLLDLAEEEGLAFRWTVNHRKTAVYATVEPSETEAQNSRVLVETALQNHPDLSTKEVAERCSVTERYVRRIRQETGQ